MSDDGKLLLSLSVAFVLIVALLGLLVSGLAKHEETALLLRKECPCKESLDVQP